MTSQQHLPAQGDDPSAEPRGRLRRISDRGRRAVAAALALALVIAVVALASSGGTAPPATGAAGLVPADALAYVNVSLDPGRPAVGQALALARRFPSDPVLTAAVLSRLSAVIASGAPVDWNSQVRPWLGNELAVAFLDTTTSTAGSLLVLDVSDRSRARAFVKRNGATPVGTYRANTLLRYPSGVELAFLGNYLVIGADQSVRAAIDVRSGSAPSLQHDGAFTSASAGEPDDRVADAYLSAGGVRRVLLARGGVLGGLGVLLDKPSLRGVAVSLSPTRGGARVRVHSALDPTLVRLSGGPGKPFAPTLQAALPSASTLLYDVTGLSRAAPQVLSAAGSAGIGGQVRPLLQRLGGALAAEGVNVHSLLSVFAGETALAITRSAERSGGSPSLIIITRTKHPAQTRAALTALEVPLAQLFPAPSSGPGQAPTFNDIQVDGVTAHQLALTPGLQLDYAVFGDLLVVSTSRDGIAAVVAHKDSIARQPEFASALAGRPDRVSSLLFLDLSQLLTLGEQTGLTRSARLNALMPDLQRIRAVGMSSVSGESDTTAELYLQIQ